MFWNYLLTAWRHILKNKLYSAINALGLAVGLTVYFFGSLLADYENSHDEFFKNSSRIYTVGTIFTSTAQVGILSIDSAHTALAPIVRIEVPEISAVARTLKREFLLSVGDNDYFQTLIFADAELLRIFDMTYLEGDASALDDPGGLLLTRSSAEKYFGSGPWIGKSITLNHDKVLSVRAVVADLPANTHFNSSAVLPTRFELVAHISVLNSEDQNAEEGNWENLNLGDLTYLLVPPHVDRDWLQTRMDGIFSSHFPDEGQSRELVEGFQVDKLTDANTFLWRAIGIPVIETVQLLAILVLVVAIVNYTNLATAQSIRRTREVGLRKTLGANRRQLLTQFLIGSVLIATISLGIAIGALEVSVALFNDALGKSLTLDYADRLPWLLFSTLAVGLVAGVYPAVLVTRTKPIDALREATTKSTRGGVFRSLMMGVQFGISIFMLGIVLVVYFQNAKIEESGDIYPRSNIVTLDRFDLPAAKAQMDVLRNEALRTPGVVGFGYSSQVPFEQSNNALGISAAKGDTTIQTSVLQISVSPGFFGTYAIPMMRGRGLSDEVSEDTLREDVYSVNVVVNELALTQLGYTLDDENSMFYDFSDSRPSRSYKIVGIVPDQNFLGFHNQIKPTVFLMHPPSYRKASMRIEDRGLQATIADIEDVWNEVVPDYPIQVVFLDETFDDVFKIFSAMTKTLAGFSFVAMTLSMVGLFGLTAFMVERRTREIGIRKVMGANRFQIARFFIWQFSKPIFWALLVALPAAYFSSRSYLGFFTNRIPLPVGVIALAGVAGVILSWGVISFHVVRIARISPIHALRHE